MTNQPPPLPGSPPPPPEPGPPPPIPDGDDAFDPNAVLREGSRRQAEQSLAAKQTTEHTRTYPCDACGGELHFDIATQMLKCAHCGNTHALVENVGEVVENDLRATLRLVHEHKRTETSGAAQLLSEKKEIVCQNCGGHTTFSGSLTANMCPYCATPIQRDDIQTAPERLPIDAVLPFSVNEKQATSLIDEWINGRWFAPNEFKTYNRTGSFQSVYMAYFTYDADTITTYDGQKGVTRTRTVGSGDNQRTETYTQWYHVNGTVSNSFDDVPVLANTGFEKSRIDKLEPWPTADAKPYSPEYVAGHLARTYDDDVEVCLAEATSTMEDGIRTTIKRDIGGNQQRIDRMDIGWRRMTYKHLLLPLWLLTVIYDQQPFQVYINGVTGEVHGARPYSKVKIAAAAIAATVLVIAIVVAIMVSRGGSG